MGLVDAGHTADKFSLPCLIGSVGLCLSSFVQAYTITNSSTTIRRLRKRSLLKRDEIPS